MNKMNIKIKSILVLSLIGFMSIVLQSFTETDSYTPVNSSELIISGNDLDVTKYRTWYRITHLEPNTGDVTGGFLGSVHKGKKGYREIYINSIGEATNKGTAPYNYPVGTIIVKEEYKDKESWETTLFLLIVTYYLLKTRFRVLKNTFKKKMSNTFIKSIRHSLM